MGGTNAYLKVDVPVFHVAVDASVVENMVAMANSLSAHIVDGFSDGGRAAILTGVANAV